MSNSNPDLDVFIAKRDEAAADLEAAVAQLPAAREAVRDAAATALAAGRRYNAISGRVLHAQRAVSLDAIDVTSPALIEILNDARRFRDDADAAHTRAKNALSDIQWRVECLRADVEQLGNVIDPPPPGGRLPEVVKRQIPGPEFVEVIVPGHAVAGEAA